MERLLKIGEVPKKHSREIKNSRIGIGFEKLDRDVFDPEKAYDKVANIGVKWVRIQSGWARTEKENGVYDFTWLDKIIDNLTGRGLVPWMCLCYGNGLYDDFAKKIFGAVGCPPIHTPEQKNAWTNYVKAVVSHYKDSVKYFEIWNEPDGGHCWKHGVSGSEYGLFAIDTAKAIKEANPNAKIIGGVVCNGGDNSFTAEVASVGALQYMDAYSFHEYTPNELHVFDRVKAFRGIFDIFKPDMEIIQGESGSQSKSTGAGALWGGSWTELKQAKQLLRHTMADLLTEVKFTSYFSCMDMIEALHGKVGDKASYLDYGYFGVLGAEFDEDGYAIGEYKCKMSYTALQSLCSVFAEDYIVTDLPILLRSLESYRIFGREPIESTFVTGGFKRSDGSCAYVYWNSADLMKSTYESTISIQAIGLPNDIKLIDPLTGFVYKMPENMIDQQTESCITLKNMPLLDYPLIVTFGNF